MGFKYFRGICIAFPALTMLLSSNIDYSYSCESHQKLKAISQEWINQNTKFSIPFCRKFQARKCQNIFIIFTVSGVTAVRSDHGVMSDISDIGAKRVKKKLKSN